MQPEPLADLLVDVHLTRARMEIGAADNSNYIDSLLHAHDVTREEYENAMAYYANNPDRFVSLMDSVIDRLRVMRPYADTESVSSIFQRPFASAVRDTMQSDDP